MDAIGIRGGRPWIPPIDLIENNDSVRVLMNVPGVETSDIDLTLTGHMLTVSGVLPEVDLGVKGECHQAERPAGEFRRSIPLPATVNPESIKATCRHGVLVVTVAKDEQQKARKVPVHSVVEATEG